MSDNRTPKASTPPPAPSRPPQAKPGGAPPASAARPAGTGGLGGSLAKLRLDPAAAMIGVGGVVLLLAIWWLWATPRADEAAAADERRVTQLEQRVASLDALREQVAAAAARAQANEQRLGAIADIDGRLRAVEQRATADLRPLEGQIAALAGRVQAVESRPTAAAPDAPREALEALSARLDRQGEQLGRTINERTAALEAAMTARLATAEQQATQRLAAVEQQAGRHAATAAERAAAVEQTVGQRVSGVEQQLGQRVAGVEQQAVQRIAALEAALAQRVAAVEQTTQRLAGLEARITRAAAIDGLRSALAAGQPLAPMLARLQSPPAELTRYATAAPPTLALMRLAFDEAARAARYASDAAAATPSTATDRAAVAVDTALTRLGGLVTVRRGEQLVWGDAADAEIEKARRALEAGDLEGAVGIIEKQPAGVRQAMQGWTDQAKALLAAQGALGRLATASAG